MSTVLSFEKESMEVDDESEMKIIEATGKVHRTDFYLNSLHRILM